MVPSGSQTDIPRIKEVHRRLRPAQVEALLAAYQAGTPVNDLASEFRTHRSTVLNLVKRHGIRPRYPALLETELAEAIQLYGSGEPLTAVAQYFGIDASTVWRTFQRAGVKMRDCQGRGR